jgi:hypothetical protein
MPGGKDNGVRNSIKSVLLYPSSRNSMMTRSAIDEAIDSGRFSQVIMYYQSEWLRADFQYVT